MKYIIKRIYLIGILFAFSPLIISILGITLFSMLTNCQSAGDHVTNCYIGGTDYADIVNLFSFLHWFTFWTLPIGLLIIFIGFIIKTNIKKRGKINN